MKVDMWYGNDIEDVTAITVTFSDIDVVYRGNLIINNKIVGDFVTQDSKEIERIFPFSRKEKKS